MAFHCLWWHSFSIISRSRRLLLRRAALSFLCVTVLKLAANASPYLLFLWTDKGCFNCKYERGIEYSAGLPSALAGGGTCWGKATVCTVPAGFLRALRTFYPFCSKKRKEKLPSILLDAPYLKSRQVYILCPLALTKNAKKQKRWYYFRGMKTELSAFSQSFLGALLKEKNRGNKLDLKVNICSHWSHMYSFFPFS